MNTYRKKILSLLIALIMVMGPGLSLVSAENLPVSSTADKEVKEGSRRMTAGEKVTANGGYFRIVSGEKVIWPKSGDGSAAAGITADEGKESGKTYTKTAYTLPAAEDGKVWVLSVKKETGETVLAGDQKYTPYTITLTQDSEGTDSKEGKAVIRYSIVYDANGGTGSIAETAGTLGQDIILSDGTGFTNDGKLLTGWNTDASGTGTGYELGAAFKADEKTADGARITLYAMWQDIPVVDAQKPQVTILGGGTVEQGQKMTLETEATVSDGGVLSYQWYKSTDGSTDNGTAIEGAVNALYEVPTLGAGTVYYYCVVTNTNENVNGEKTAWTVSKATEVTVTEPEPEIVNAQEPVIEWISRGGTFEKGDKAKLEIEATVSDGGVLSYQWYKNTDNSTDNGTAIEGAVNALYEVPTQEAGTVYYYCVVTNTNENVNGEKTAWAASEATEVTVTEPEPEIVNAQEPVIEWISRGGTFEKGDKAKLEIEATVSDGGVLSYQWYKNTDNSTDNGTAIEGAVNALYEVPTQEAGTVYYYCVVTNTNENVNGEKTARTVSDTVKVMVEQAVSAPENAQQPKVEGPVGGTYYESDNYALKVKASVDDGGTLVYQWYKNKEKIEGADKAEYTPSVGTAYYYCVVTNINQQATDKKTAYTVSEAVQVTIKEGERPKKADTPSVSGPAGGTYYKGQSPKLEVKASVDDGGTLTYQWYKNSRDNNENGTLIKDAVSSTYLPSTKAAGTTYYYCTVTNTNKEASKTKSVSVVTKTAKISVIEKGSVKSNVKRASTVSKKTNKNTDTKAKAANAKTGDENNLFFWLVLMAGAGTAATALVLRKRQRR